MDIDKELNKIEAMRQFEQEAVPLDIVPASQRVQAYLAEMYGAAWYSAKVATYALPGGQSMHAVFILYPTGMVVRVVAEDASGTLVEGHGVPIEEEEGIHLVDNTPEPAAQPETHNCLEQIVPALLLARAMVKASNYSKKDKKWVRSQIMHAVKHLVADPTTTKTEE